MAQAFQPVPITQEKNYLDMLLIYGWSGQAVSLINQVLNTRKFTLAHDGLQVKYIPTPQELTTTRTLATRLARKNLKL